MLKKHQQLMPCSTGLYITIPEKAVAAFEISTKRFFAWEKTREGILGTFCKSETLATTRVRVGENDRYVADILHAYVIKYDLKPTKQSGPTAVFEWDDTTLRIHIALQR